MIETPSMWVRDTIIPWTPLSGGFYNEISLINELQHEKALVSLIGTPKGGQRGRFGFVGLPTKIIKLNHDGSNFDASMKPDSKMFRVIALGYELGRNWVNLDPESAPRNQPAGIVFELNSIVILDHKIQQFTLVGHHSHHTDQLLECIARLSARPNQKPRNSHGGSVQLHPLTSDAVHSQRIKQAQNYIAAGDIYQANISRRLVLDGSITGTGILAALNSLNPVAHGAYIKWNNLELVSNTMETLFNADLKSRKISSYPIKGTCARQPHETRSACTPQQLLATPKERAEHIMIVDLVRNDLGRICTPGTVKVPRLMNLEGYEGVWHGVSTITGRLAPTKDINHAIRSLFPGGSITGAPKRRAVQIIRELEEDGRGFYTGSIGIMAPNGYASFSILIRTLIKDSEGWSLSVGGGIVADSQSKREISETWEKVAVFKKVLSS